MASFAAVRSSVEPGRGPLAAIPQRISPGSRPGGLSSFAEPDFGPLGSAGGSNGNSRGGASNAGSDEVGARFGGIEDEAPTDGFGKIGDWTSGAASADTGSIWVRSRAAAFAAGFPVWLTAGSGRSIARVSVRSTGSSEEEQPGTSPRSPSGPDAEQRAQRATPRPAGM